MAYKQNRSIIAGTSGHRSALKQKMMIREGKPLQPLPQQPEKPIKIELQYKQEFDMSGEIEYI